MSITVSRAVHWALFATVYIFVDEYFPKDVRSSAQGLFNFLILGAGPFFGAASSSKGKEHLPQAAGRKLGLLA